MYFTKYPHRANFSFPQGFDPEGRTLEINGQSFRGEVASYEGDVYHVRVTNDARWDGNKCLESLILPPPSERHRLKAIENFELQLLGRNGSPILRSVAGEGFGVCGKAHLFQFEVGEEPRFYGMGEKNFATFELSGYRTKYWNTDVWGDFSASQWGDGPVDPPYFATPYLVVKTGDEYIGLLLHNPYATFMETPGIDESRVFVEWQRTSNHLIVGSEDGEPNLWVLYGPSLRELTQKLQKLVGVTPVPPLWSLGYHQSRWGYAGHDDLMDLDAQFERHKIPCDSLWMDLDYMDGYRIFKTSETAFPGGATVTAAALEKNGRRIVPILDPGVKFEPGYAVYEDGHKQDVFCRNAEGKEFVGLVWPGETVFPDFSQGRPRTWWAGYVYHFAREGFGGTWLDMNDPSTGPVDPQGMLFNEGKEPHAAYHNQYALGMQMATHEGFLQAKPNERPFILSRSGFIGSSKHAAIWTGDNLSNYFYLKASIPTSLGLSLSGLPFNGPDLGGFGGDVTDDLMVDWTKAGFLFPFLRNHCGRGQRPQEPFNFPAPVMGVLRRYIRLRYKLLPYLYNLFVQQEATGDPIMRPLLYEFEDAGLDRIDDQFLIGPSVLQAPFIDKDQKTRTVILPGSEPWYDATNGDWVEPGTVKVKKGRETTPLYVRCGAILPMQPGTPTDNRKELREVHFHLFIPPTWSGETELEYVADDGLTFDYRNGARSTLRVTAVSVDGNLAIRAQQTANGFGAINPTFVVHGEPKSVRVNGADVAMNGGKVVLTGKPLDVKVLG
jgi:alpha-glucosidase